MRKTFLVLGLMGTLSLGSVYAQEFHLQPTPQEYQAGQDSVMVPVQYSLQAETAFRETPAFHLLNTLFPKGEGKDGFPVYVGVKGDKSVKKYVRRVPKQAEGYYLGIEKDRIVIVGADERGAYYGVQTLAQLMTLGKLPLAEVTDYPDVPYRGVVEGFYGTPGVMKPVSVSWNSTDATR